MRIIKHGDQKYFREVEHTCESCGCVFRFMLNDISTHFEYNQEQGSFIPVTYVTCPECKTPFVLNTPAAAEVESAEDQDPVFDEDGNEEL